MCAPVLLSLQPRGHGPGAAALSEGGKASGHMGDAAYAGHYRLQLQAARASRGLCSPRTSGDPVSTGSPLASRLSLSKPGSHHLAHVHNCTNPHGKQTSLAGV